MSSAEYKSIRPWLLALAGGMGAQILGFVGFIVHDHFMLSALNQTLSEDVKPKVEKLWDNRDRNTLP